MARDLRPLSLMPLLLRHQKLGASSLIFIFPICPLRSLFFFYFLSCATGVSMDYGISPKFVCTPIPPEADPSCYSPPSVPPGSGASSSSSSSSSWSGFMSEEAKSTILHLRESLVRQKETILDQRETIRELTAKLTRCEGGFHDNHHYSSHSNHHDDHHETHHDDHHRNHYDDHHDSHHSPSGYHSGDHDYNHNYHRTSSKFSNFSPEQTSKTLQTLKERLDSLQARNSSSSYSSSLRDLLQRKIHALEEQLQEYYHDHHDDHHSGYHHNNHHDDHHYGHHDDHYNNHHDKHHGYSHYTSHRGHHDDHHNDHHDDHHNSHHDDHHRSHHDDHNRNHHDDHHKSHHDDHHNNHHDNHHNSHHDDHHRSHLVDHHDDHHGHHRYNHDDNHHDTHHGRHHDNHHYDHHDNHHKNHHYDHHDNHHYDHHDKHHDDHHNNHHGNHHSNYHNSHHGNHHYDHHDDHHNDRYYRDHHHEYHKDHGDNHHDDEDPELDKTHMNEEKVKNVSDDRRLEFLLKELHHEDVDDEQTLPTLKNPTEFLLDFPLRTNYMYGRMKRSLDEEIFALTICLWLKPGAGPGLGTPFSYAIPGQTNELVLIEWGSNPMQLLVNDKAVNLPITFTDDKWHHMCVTWTTRDGVWEVFQDGQKRGAGQNLSPWQAVRPGGVFILGQEQDDVGGHFDVTQSFMGQMSDLQLWSRVLTPAEIESQASCTGHLEGDILSWKQENVELHGGLAELDHEPCQ